MSKVTTTTPQKPALIATRYANAATHIHTHTYARGLTSNTNWQEEAEAEVESLAVHRIRTET